MKQNIKKKLYEIYITHKYTEIEWKTTRFEWAREAKSETSSCEVKWIRHQYTNSRTIYMRHCFFLSLAQESIHHSLQKWIAFFRIANRLSVVLMYISIHIYSLFSFFLLCLLLYLLYLYCFLLELNCAHSKPRRMLQKKHCQSVWFELQWLMLLQWLIVFQTNARIWLWTVGNP